MNYKSQLRGWAVDRVIELARVTKHPLSISELKEKADEIAAYAYVAREDLESTARDLFDLIKQAPDGKSGIDGLLATLEHLRNERIANGLDRDVKAEFDA